MKILVIEDDKKVSQALKKGMESKHYKVEVAYAGEEGFFLISTQKFDLIILDLDIQNAPCSTGYSFIISTGS